MLRLSTLLLAITYCIAFPTLAETQGPEPTEQPLIRINMSLDLKGVEQSINQSSESIEKLAHSLTLLSTNQSLNDEQKQVLVDTIENINELTELSKQSLQALPGALEQSQNSIASSTKRFADDVRVNVLLLLGLIVMAIIIALVCAYWLILRPMQGTILSATRNVSKMATAINKTAESLETTTENQKILTARLEVADSTQSEEQTSRS
jgi:hypothetical protein